MKLTLKRAIAASLPLVLLAGSTIAAGAAQAGRQFFAPFGLPTAAAGPAVLGGGATLPVPAYLGKSVAGAYQSSGTSSLGVAGSIFGYFGSQVGGLSVEYCSTGSGKGKGVFDGAINTVDIPCSNAASTSTATTFGFLAPSGSPRQTYPSIAGTDAPLAQTDYTSYIADHPAPLEPVELPSIFGSIAILYHDNALNNPPAHARIVLTDAQICGVYNGSIKTFGALLGNGDPTAIVPVYRKDGSGTSFNFSNHLQAACPTLGFGVNQTFTSADSHLPASAVAATGNGGVLKEVIAQNGAFGYVEAGYVTNTPGGTGSPNYADVKNTHGVVLDPFAGLPAAANTVSSSVLQTNVVVNQTTSGPATLSRLTGVRFGNCVKVVPPSAYANPSTGYPIIAVTYLLTNSAGNGSVGASALRLLERDLTTGSLFKHPRATTPITTVDEAEPFVAVGTTGYSSLGGTFSSTIQTTANTCINV